MTTTSRKPTDQQIVRVEIAARILGLSKSVLDRWRLKGIGPPWIRLGSKTVGYPLDALHQWIEDNTQRGSRGAQR